MPTPTGDRIEPWRLHFQFSPEQTPQGRPRANSSGSAQSELPGSDPERTPRVRPRATSPGSAQSELPRFGPVWSMKILWFIITLPLLRQRKLYTLFIPYHITLSSLSLGPYLVIFRRHGALSCRGVTDFPGRFKRACYSVFSVWW